MVSFRTGAAVAALASLFFVSCGGGSSPAEPDAPATPAPTPTPAPSATPRAFSCPLPSLPDHQQPCPKLDPRFAVEVNLAIDEVINTRPELFNFNDNLGAGSWKVVDRTKYVRLVTESLNRMSLCTSISAEEIGVKNTNDFNEQWNIITGTDYVRRKYVTTCIPSAF